MAEAYLTGVGHIPNGSYDRSEGQLASTVLSAAMADAGLHLDTIDRLYLPSTRPWAGQHFLSTFLGHRLGLPLARNVEIYTGGTSGGVAFRTAVEDVRAETVEVAVVLAVERSSTRTTAEYFATMRGLFDAEYQAPLGPTIPGMYAMSLQRYRHEFDVSWDAIGVSS